MWHSVCRVLGTVLCAGLEGFYSALENVSLEVERIGR